MEKASKVMYSIANVFNWILVLLLIAGITIFSLMYVGVIQNTTEYQGASMLGAIIYLSIALFFALITVAMVRKAKADGSSKFWDFLFMIFGILGANIFYFLGGLFGLIAPRNQKHQNKLKTHQEAHYFA